MRKSKKMLAGLLAASMVFGAMPVYAAPETKADSLQNKVLDLKFEDNLEDASGKGNNGTLSTGAPEYVDGISGKAIKLNGNSYINLGKSTDLQPQNLTLSFWFKPNADMGNGEQLITWNKVAYNTDGWYLSSENGNTPLALSIGPDTKADNPQPYKVAVNSNRAEFFPTGEWTHVVVTYNSEDKAVKIYRNGVECQTSISYNITSTATGILGSDAAMEKSIGYNGPQYKAGYMKAAIDEYQLYNDVADSNEVIALYEEAGITFDKKAVAQQDIDALVLPATAMGNLSLPSTGKAGSDITWESMNKQVITDEGVVTRPEMGENPVEVTLKASASYKGGEAVTKEFKVTVEPKKEITLDPTSLMGQVGLGDAYLVNAQEKEEDYLLSLNAEKFLFEFYKVAGLQPTTEEGYGGWERSYSSNFRGHTFGHYMSALSQAYLSSDDKETKAALMEQIEDAINGLAACQSAYAAQYEGSAGYISAFPEGELRKIDGVESPTDKGSDNLIVPYYNLHKVLAGLIDVSKNVDDKEVKEKALTIAEGFGEYLYNRMQKLTDKNKMLSTEYGGMNEALYELYRITGNDHYKVAAHYFDETNLFKDLAAGKDVLNGKHANTTIPKLTGALKRYTTLSENQEYYERLTQAEKDELNMYLEAAKNFWDITINHHTYVTGGNSQSEHFHEADKLAYDATKGEYDASTTCETCNTYNMLKLSKELYRVTKDKKYMDYFENTYINAILSSQNPETGTTMYFQPMAPGYNKVYNRPFDEFWCCTGTGMENFSKLGDNIYYVEGDSVYVHMFYESEFTDTAHNLALKQEANVPNSDTVKFTVSAAGNGSVKAGTKLRLRKPDWIAGTAEIKVNNKAAELKEDKGYFVIENVKAGDTITYKMPMKVKAYATQDNANFVAFKYGPVVLSTALSTNNMDASAANGILVRVGTFDPTVKTAITVQNYKDIKSWLADVEKNLVRIEDSKDGQVQFKLKNTDSEELTYTPHYMRHKERYGLYMYLEIADSETSQQRILANKEAIRDKEMSTDYLYTFDNNNSEFEKNLQASANSSASSFSGRQLRHAEPGGWFSYDMKIDPKAEHNYLNCDFYSGDRSREFDIFINGELLETYKYGDAPSDNQFFVHTVEIPKSMLTDLKDGNKVTIKFASTSKNTYVGGLFGISTSTAKEYNTDASLKSLSFDKGTLAPAFAADQTSYTLEVPKDAENVVMEVSPKMESGLVYVGNILIDDTLPRTIELTGDTTKVTLTAKAQDHKTAKDYTITIRKEGAAPEKADKTKLQEAIDKAKAVKTDKYTDTTVKAMNDALKAAEDLMKDEGLTGDDQEKIDAAAEALNDAIDKLETKKVEDVFKDISADSWYRDYVQYVFDRDIMTGLKKDEFGPDVILARSHFATMLYRIEGEPGVTYTDRFKDVPDGEFYTNPVMWASDEEVGVISGYLDGKFGPNDNITREQMAVMLFRYAEYKGYDVKVKDDLTRFEDASKVSEFAQDAMQWAVGAELIKGEGEGNELNPQGATSRAVCATIMQRFIEKYDK